MLKRLRIYSVFVLAFVLLLTAGPTTAQLGNSGSIEGVVKDPSGGVVAGATVEISYAVSGFHRNRRELQVHERPFQFLSLGAHSRGIRELLPGCGCALGGSHDGANQLEDWDGSTDRERGGEGP